MNIMKWVHRYRRVIVRITALFFWTILLSITVIPHHSYFLGAANTTSGIYLGADDNSNLHYLPINHLPPAVPSLALEESAFDNYFVIREDLVSSSVNFKLLALSNINTSPDNSKTTTAIRIDNAFNVSYFINSNQQKSGVRPSSLEKNARYIFTYDELLQLRKISRINESDHNQLHQSSKPTPTMVLHFDSSGQVRYLRESIPNLNIHFVVWFNDYGQITHKRLESGKYLREQTYTYNNHNAQEHFAKLRTIATFNHSVLISADVFSYTNSADGYPQTRIDKHNGRGQLLRTITVTPMESHGPGTKVESLVVFGPAGKIRSELMRFWNNHQLFEEWSYIKGGYQRTLYGYDSEGMLQDKTIIDEKGRSLSYHSYDYEIPSELYGLIFIKELTLRTSEESLYFTEDSDSGISNKRRSVFDLYSLLLFYQENYTLDGRSFRRMSYPAGMEIISEGESNTITKTIIDRQNQITLAERTFHYDSYGRLSTSLQKFPNETQRLTKYFYSGAPLLPNLSEINPPGTTNQVLITYNSFYAGQIFWEFVKTRQEHMAKAPLNLEEQFKKFVTLEKDNNNSGKQSPLLAQEKRLVSQLLFLRANKLSKVLSYDRQGNLAYYHRFQYRNLGDNIFETRFTYYDIPPNLNLNNRRFEIFAPLSNTYNYTHIGNDIYSLLNPYLREGGLYEFRELGVDGINPNKERPRETIVIRHTHTRILSDAKQIFYNRYSGKPEREEVIRGPLRTLIRLDSVR